MDISLTQLKHLLAIAQSGTFSQAAQELHVSQAALSRSVITLEKRFGVRIFDRGRGGATLTSVGEQVIADAQWIVRHAASLQKNLQLYGRGEGGAVAVGFGPVVASVVLPEVATSMLRDHPALKLRTSIKSAESLCEDVLNGSLETAYCSRDLLKENPELVIEKLGSMTVSLLVRTGHPLLASGAQPSETDYAGFPFASSTEMLPSVYGGLQGALICENFEIIRKVVLESDAIWFTADRIAAEDLAAGSLCKLPGPLFPRSVEVVAIRLRSRMNSPAVRTLTARISGALESPLGADAKRHLTQSANPSLGF